VREGETYSVSRDAGTLALDAFAGYDPWYIDATRPADGTIRVQSACARTIVAEVSIKATAVPDSREKPEEAQESRELSLIGVFTFEREKVGNAKP
jgi:hypothetical protein